MYSIKDAAIIRELRADYKFGWLAELIKEVVKESVTELRDEDQKRREEEKTKSKAPKPLSIQDVADRYDKSKATVHNWMKQGIIKGFKMGKGRFFYLDELEKSLAQYRYLDVLEKKGLVEKRKSFY